MLVQSALRLGQVMLDEHPLPEARSDSLSDVLHVVLEVPPCLAGNDLWIRDTTLISPQGCDKSSYHL